MKSFVRTLFALLLSTLFAYVIVAILLGFAAESRTTPAVFEWLFVWLSPTSGALFLRVLFPLAFWAATAYMIRTFSSNRDLKSEFLNRFRGRAYSYAAERQDFYHHEALGVLFACLFAAALPAFLRYWGPWYVLYPAKVALYFILTRIFAAICRYVWCAERLGGLQGKTDE